MAMLMKPANARSQEAFLRWFEDETFYSLCCRQNHFLAHIDTSSTSEWLFGSRRCAISHDFPCNLDALSIEARAAWGEPVSIIGQHTILPLFFPFQSEHQIETVVQTMKSGRIGSMKYRLGLLTGRFGAEHPLKACTACMANDQAAHGTAYWHLTHQYPGVVLCPIHGVMLRESTINRQWSGSFQWALPSDASLSAATSPILSSTDRRALQQLGTCVLDLATCGISRRFSPTIVRSVYKEALNELAISGSGRDRAAISFAKFSSTLQPYPPLTSLPTTVHKAGVFIDQLTRNPRGHCHPLKHLTLIIWLFGRLEFFIEAYDRLNQLPLPKPEVKRDCSAKPVMSDDPLVDRIPEKPVLRKPKKLKPQIRTTVLEHLQSGDSKESICSEFGLSICTLNRLLRSEPAVQIFRTEKQEEATLLKHRTQWLAVVNAQPNASTKNIRANIPSIYAWLYRNDREWLLEQTHNLPSGRCGNNSKVDWYERDSELADLVSAAFPQAFSKEENIRLRKNEIFIQFPTLSRALEKKGQYLKTRKILSGIINRKN